MIKIQCKECGMRYKSKAGDVPKVLRCTCENQSKAFDVTEREMPED